MKINLLLSVVCMVCLSACTNPIWNYAQQKRQTFVLMYHDYRASGKNTVELKSKFDDIDKLGWGSVSGDYIGKKAWEQIKQEYSEQSNPKQTVDPVKTQVQTKSERDLKKQKKSGSGSIRGTETRKRKSLPLYTQAEDGGWLKLGDDGEYHNL